MNLAKRFGAASVSAYISRAEKLKWIAGLSGVILAVTLGYRGTAHAWGSTGHEIVAYVAAAHLTPAAQRAVASLLHTPDSKEAVANAMAAASILPDTDFRKRDPSTMSWHFVNLCLQDQRSEIAERCAGNCVVAKINENADRLRTARYDTWGGDGDLAFLIHFLGDINQPLHAATNADLGGNCVSIRPANDIKNLHIMWDVELVNHLQSALGSSTAQETARDLDTTFAKDRPQLRWNSNSAADLAWHSQELARSQVYDSLKIPLEPCQPKIHSCPSARQEIVDIDQSYLDRESRVAGEQLAIAGFELANMLNDIWK